MQQERFNILVVDDDAIDAEAVRRVFRKHKLVNPFYYAQDGMEALEVLRGKNSHEKLPDPYVILLDLNMPRMNGLEFLEVIRSDDELRRSKIFVLTTSDNEEDKEKAYQYGIGGYIKKKNLEDELMPVVSLCYDSEK